MGCHVQEMPTQTAKLCSLWHLSLASKTKWLRHLRALVTERLKPWRGKLSESLLAAVDRDRLLRLKIPLAFLRQTGVFANNISLLASL